MEQKSCGGKRLLGKQPSFDERFPSISVITVTYNRLCGLYETFSSVISQTYTNIEYIIIDGGSQDGSVNFLQHKDEMISYWVSEKDAGIYDAMNKGALAATGDWIIFMNSGDQFFSQSTLAQVATHLDTSGDVAYGGFASIVVDRYQTRIFQRLPQKLSDIWHHIPTCHQSIFVKRKLQTQFPFDTSFTWCADHDFIVKLYVRGCSFKEIPIMVSKFDASGGDSRDILTYTKERWRISTHLAHPLKRNLYFLQEYWRFFIWKNITCKIRNFLPKEWVIALRRWRGTC
ncbi:glycosyltransferase family 2 protein [Scytonema sp. PRP1]|uniref:glycosyltransferase family 2 protein n=1 Tax=Scytonema sp. PRP1 TaxID=3120513 RepID=UPI002FCEC07F